MKPQSTPEKSYPVKVNFENDEVLVYTVRLPGRRAITETVKQREVKSPSLPQSMTLAAYNKLMQRGGARTGRAVGHFENAQLVVYTVTLSDGRSFTRNTEKRRLAVVSTAPARKVVEVVGDPVAVAFAEKFRRTMRQQAGGAQVRLA